MTGDVVPVEKEKRTTKSRYHLLMNFGCFIIIILVPICFCVGTPQLIFHWAQWKIQNIDDYQIRVKYVTIAIEDDFLLTVCDGIVVQAECLAFPFRLNDEPYCPFDLNPNAPEYMHNMYSLDDMQKYTIDSLFSQALNDHWLPTCRARYNFGGHYPKYVGCFFIEGAWTEVSEFTPITCSGNS